MSKKRARGSGHFRSGKTPRRGATHRDTRLASPKQLRARNIYELIYGR